MGGSKIEAALTHQQIGRHRLRSSDPACTLSALSGGVVQENGEHQVGPLKIRIDRLLCVGFGDCIEIAPEAFEFDHEGIVVLKPDAPQVERDRLIVACERCPVDAITVWDENGVQVVPKG
jgi:ferredoxin